MRILDFGGEIPKLKPQALPLKNAQLAENVDLYGGVIRPHRAPTFQQHLVDEYGKPFSGGTLVKTLAVVGSYMVGFTQDLHWVIDPRESAGVGTILFVRDGQLWRLSPRMLAAGTGATPVGIDPPKESPTVAVAVGQGCLSEWQERCLPSNPKCDDDTPEVRGYRITYINECGEESAPSPVSNLIDLRNGDGAIVVDTNTPPANAVYRRYYRSAVSTDGETVWLFVAEDVIADNTFIDDVCPSQLGEALTTEQHQPPSKCLDGVALGRNMLTVVWSNNQFWVSEPRLPHAYKVATRVTLPYQIRFIASHTTFVEGNTHYDIAIATSGYPYMAAIRDDGQTTIKELEAWFPAVSAYGWGVLDGTVYYASTSGIVGIVGSKVSLVTDSLLTELEWAAFRPDTMRLTGYEQRLFIWYSNAADVHAGLVLVLPATDKRRDLSLSRLTVQAVCAVASPDTGMYLLIGTDVYKWGMGEPMRYTWRSRVEVNSANWFPTVFKVVSDDLPNFSKQVQQEAVKFAVWKKQNVGIDDMVYFDTHSEARPYMVQLLGKQLINFKLYADGREIYSRDIRNSSPIMIKRVRRAIEWAVEVSGTAVLRELHLQKSHNDLQNDGGHA